jgi:hypothetical protein
MNYSSAIGPKSFNYLRIANFGSRKEMNQESRRPRVKLEPGNHESMNCFSCFPGFLIKHYESWIADFGLREADYRASDGDERSGFLLFLAIAR